MVPMIVSLARCVANSSPDKKWRQEALAAPCCHSPLVSPLPTLPNRLHHSSLNFGLYRTPSPTRSNFTGDSFYSSPPSAAATSSNSFALDRFASQVRSARHPVSPEGCATMKPIPCTPPRKTCMCSPSSHPGSFRCSLHKNSNKSPSSTQSRLKAQRSAMTNWQVRIGGVEGESIRRTLTPPIRPSRHHMRRRSSFQPRPSRLCHMTMGSDPLSDAVNTCSSNKNTSSRDSKIM